MVEQAEFKQVQFSAASIPPSIPELSTWAMMLAGFAGLGLAAFPQKRRDAFHLV